MADLMTFTDDRLDAVMAEGTDDPAIVREYLERRLRRSLIEHAQRLLAAVVSGELLDAAALANGIEHAITDPGSGVAEAFGWRHDRTAGVRRLVKSPG